MGKTSTQEQAQQIDPMLRQDAIKNTNLIRALAAMGYNPYEGNTIAGLSDSTVAAADMADSFASAFGMTGSAGAGARELVGTDDGSGILGFSPFEGMKEAMGEQYTAFRDQLDSWFQKASKKTKYQPQLETSGGKK